MNRKLIHHISGLVLVFSLAGVGLLFPACLPIHAGGPQITSLEATHLYLYPTGKTELTCTTSAPDSEQLTYVWVSTEGTFEGTGDKVTWKAPNKYGEFHIMVTATDGQGNKDDDSITITVVVNENQATCPTCRR
jgi:FlaG/FlaF family flagellin (archaellin)